MRAHISRAAASAEPAASWRASGAPNTHRATSPANLLTSPPCDCVTSTTIAKKR